MIGGYRTAMRTIPLLAVALLLAVPALAHGPSVQLSYGRVSPLELTIRVGDTVHFRNANPGFGACTIVGEALQGPTLAPGEGWHHTFEEPGVFPYHLKEYTSSKGRILVASPD